MDNDFCGEVVIKGITSAGRVFRPSDWAERLASITSNVGMDNRLNYCPCVQPITRDGVRCVVISKSLDVQEPRVFKFLMDFARDNDLVVLDGRHQLRA